MFNWLDGSIGLIILLAIFGFGAALAILFRRYDRVANILGNGIAILGGVWGLILATSVLMSDKITITGLSTHNLSMLPIGFTVDKLSAFFVGLICLVVIYCSVYALGYVKHYYGHYNIGNLGLCYNLFILGMLLVVTAGNGILFLIGWELMSLASYFLVVYEHQEPANIKAGYLYLLMTHLGTACLMLAFLILFGLTGSFDFLIIQQHISIMPAVAHLLVFILLLVGLGVKAGVIPAHIWLPAAHPAAPSHVSALMSGVMIKTAIYMMIRLFLDIIQPLPMWCGILLMALGAISALLGVLYALAESDIKRLLAYSSIENIGIILLALGAAMVFASLNRPDLEILALAAALFHIFNHAIFKSVLFMSAGSVIMATRTRRLAMLGGLLKKMPYTGLAFLVGAMAITALPPFNGFFGEWLVFQSFVAGLGLHDSNLQWIFGLAIAALFAAGGLALACFVKVFGVAFLARSRSVAASKAVENSRFMSVAMIFGAGLCFVIGCFAGPVISVLGEICRSVVGINYAQVLDSNLYGVGLKLDGMSSRINVWSTIFVLLAAIGIVWLIARYAIYRSQKISYAKTWDCGTTLTGRMEITDTGFARSLAMIFKGLLRPTLQHNAEYNDSANRYSPSNQTVTLQFKDIYRIYLYNPVYSCLLRLSCFAKRVQNGNLNTYILYIFIGLIVALMWSGL